jgi:hypothetical protein
MFNIIKYTSNLLGELFLFLFCCTQLTAENFVEENLIPKITQRATENQKEIKKYGYNMSMEYRWLNSDGTTKRTETKDYRTVWLNGKPHLELFQINSRTLNSNQIKDEEKTKKEWRAATHNDEKKSSSHRIPFDWEEIMDKYDFTLDSNDHSKGYVFTFTHKNTKLPVRSRMEKVLNHLNGKMWVDEQFRITKLEASLRDGISFGFGLAKVTQLNMECSQQGYNNLIVPWVLRASLKVRALFVYSQRLQITTRFNNYHSNLSASAGNSTIPIVRP